MPVSDFDYRATLHAMAQGQASALDSLFYQEAPHMLALANSVLQRRVEAEEVIRETYVLLWKNAAAYDPGLGKARAWIYSILRFRLASRLRSRSSTVNPSTNSLPSIAPGPQQPLTCAIGELEPLSQRGIILAYLQGQGYEKMASQLGQSAAQLRLHVQASLQQLEKQCLPAQHNLEARHSALIAEYALGLLSQQELSQAHSLMQASDEAASLALHWESALLELLDFLPAVQPTPTSLAHIYRTLDLGVPQRPQKTVTDNKAATPAETATTTPDTPAPAPAASNAGASRKEPVLGIPQEAHPPSYSSLLRQDQGTASTVATDSKPETAPNSPAPSNTRAIKRRQKAVSEKAASAAASQPLNTTEQPAPKKTKPAKPALRVAKLPNSVIWPLASIILLLVAVLCAYQWYKEAHIPNVTVIEMRPVQGGILQAPGLSSSPAWTLTVDPQGNVFMLPKVQTELLPGQTVQLWTQFPGQSEIRSLGLIDPNRPITVPASLVGRVLEGQIFEMTLEQEGGAQSGHPQGAVLYIGSVVQFGAMPDNVPATSSAS